MIPLRDTERSSSRPYMVVALIAVNTLLFLYEAVLPPAGFEEFLYNWAMIPDRLAVYSLFTSMFLHGGWLHLLGNMWFLWVFGDKVDDLLGHKQFLVFYVLCGLAGGIAQLVTNIGSPVPVIGASGAIAGVMGAYMVKFPRSRILTLVPIVIFFTTIEVPAPFLLAYWLLIQVVSGGMALGQSAMSGGTAWFAHVGGFVAGLLLVRLFPARQRHRYIDLDRMD